MNDTETNATLTSEPLVQDGAIELAEHVFTDPDAFDFSPAAEEFSGLGVNEDVLDRMKLKMAEFGLIITRISVNVDVSYLEKIRHYIFDTWPTGLINEDKDDSDYRDLLMHVKMTDEDGNNVKCTYTYEQRSYYPEAPEGVHCE